VSAGDRISGLSAGEMRRRFDAAFGAAPLDREEEAESFLALRIGPDGYALRVRETAGFAAARKIVPFPSPMAEMLGLAAVRGTVVPVFSMAALIGYGQGEGPPRWFVLSASADPVALAFSEFDGYVEAPRSELSAVEEADEKGPVRPHVRQVLRARGEVRGVIDVPSVARAIQTNENAARER
jgi:chemotaxis signal transduction protein